MKLKILFQLTTSLLITISFGANLAFSDKSHSDGVRVPEIARPNNEIFFSQDLAPNEITQIDVLFFYSNEVLSQQGSIPVIQHRVNDAVNYANETFKNSEIKLRVRAVGLEASPISEVNNADFELTQITENAFAQDLRIRYQADVVTLLVSHNSGGNYCGLGYILEGLNYYSNLYAYNIVSLHGNCADWVFVHELGHNLGAQHDIDNVNTPGLFPNSHGYRFDTLGYIYRTVMAYAPGLVLPYFSSPSVLYQGVPIGTPDADNAGTINYSKDFVASYFGDSKTTLNSTIRLQGKAKNNKCNFTASLNTINAGTNLEIYSRIKKKQTLVKVIPISTLNNSELKFSVKRTGKNKLIRGILRDAFGEYSSTEVRCKKKTS